MTDKIARSKAPLRLGLAGGGTDVSPYCDEFGGAVLNITIDRYAHATIASRDDNKVEFVASDLEQSELLDCIPEFQTGEGLIIHRGVYNRIIKEFNNGEPLALTITTGVDAPPGSGLGSSSALVVALVEAFQKYLNLPLGTYDIAYLAFEIERIDLGLNGGRQDQYASAFGGMNFIEFLANNRVIVNPLRMDQDILNEFEESLVICFTGVSRASADIIDEQSNALINKNKTSLAALHQIKEDAVEMKQALLAGDMSAVAKILAHSWQAKKRSAESVSNKSIDVLYDTAMNNGALAGKVSGAGGGGFMMFITDPTNRQNLKSVLRKNGAEPSNCQFTHRGAVSWMVSRKK